MYINIENVGQNQSRLDPSVSNADLVHDIVKVDMSSEFFEDTGRLKSQFCHIEAGRWQV